MLHGAVEQPLPGRVLPNGAGKRKKKFARNHVTRSERGEWGVVPRLLQPASFPAVGMAEIAGVVDTHVSGFSLLHAHASRGFDLGLPATTPATSDCDQ